MSDLPAHALGYQEVVAEYFLGLRGAGLMLSPLDQELVAEWERRGLPVAVVCRGIRRGVEALSGDRRAPARSVRALRFAVEEEWRAYQSGRVGDAPPPPGEESAAARRLAEARARLAEGSRGGSLAEAYREAERTLAAGGGGGSPLERVEALLDLADARLLGRWLASLPAGERAALGKRIRFLAGPRRRGESRRAYRQGLRAHLFDLARQAGLNCLRGTV
ncbi:MAG TPA: hypothetical protein VFG59_21580 [Anaeromyxobacter sp.]|nr:hypothetical protein [Anaeromyxobacter sp.]